MTGQGLMGDLVALVPDKNMQFSLQGLLSRPDALNIRPVKSSIWVHPQRDPGCLRRSHDFLRPFSRQFARALVMVDREGCGQESSLPDALEQRMEDQLSRSGWEQRAAAVVLDPELEVWVWSDSPEVDRVLGWSGRKPALRDWLRNEGFLSGHVSKPQRPKEAVEQALWLARKPRSSSLYLQLAQSVQIAACKDPAFLKLKRTLRRWFPARG